MREWTCFLAAYFLSFGAARLGRGDAAQPTAGLGSCSGCQFQVLKELFRAGAEVQKTGRMCRSPDMS